MDAASKTPITRRRELQACTECRRRKLKCDRQTPCLSCSKRGDEEACTYQRSTDALVLERERRLHAEARLEHLERLVQELSSNRHGDVGNGENNNCKEANLGSARQRSGVESQAPVSVKDDFVTNGSTHWSGMLEHNEGAISSEHGINVGSNPETTENISTSLILGSATSLSLQQVLNQYLPSRQEANRLVAAYFRSRNTAAPFIHGPSFRRRYQTFWINPSEAPVLWTSILFSICHIAKNTLTVGKSDLDRRFEIASAHCLAIGQYFRPKPHAVESLLLFLQAQCWIGLGISHDMSLMFGVLIRLATRMGYHRDPSNFHLSPFEGEMRRRTWSLCMQMDLLVSFHLGLPSVIQYPTWDTEAPRNLLDTDLDEDTEELPPARPDSEVTDITFYIAKHKLMAVFEKTLRHCMSVGIDTGTDVHTLDTELNLVYEALPLNIRSLPMTDSVVDPPSLIVTRLCVFFLYQKCRCVLHRPRILQGEISSTLICYEAASELVRCFNDWCEEFLPGGQLEGERWFMSSITWHYFLLGIMALCLVLCVKRDVTDPIGISFSETLTLLQRARDICEDQADKDKDSKRVQRVVMATLSRFERYENRALYNGMDESGFETGSTDPFLPQTSSTGETENGQSSLMLDFLPEGPLQVTDAMWNSDQALGLPVDDCSWAFLEQFLDIPIDDAAPGG